MHPEQSEVTPELKNLILNFVGQTYGEIHKLDKDIVQAATNLQPASEMLKARATSIMNSITPQRQQQFAQPAFSSAPLPQTEFVNAPSSHTELVPVIDPNQLEFNLQTPGIGDNLLSVMKSIDSKLGGISTKLDVIVEKLSN